MPVAHPVALHAHAHRRVDHLDRAIVRVINQARSFSGLPTLRVRRPLTRVARAHSADMLRHHLLSHSSSSGASFSTRVHRVTRAAEIGETIAAFSGRPSARNVVGAWLRSPQHRVELLSRAYRTVGVGRVRRHGRSVITADFASSR